MRSYVHIYAYIKAVELIFLLLPLSILSTLCYILIPCLEQPLFSPLKMATTLLLLLLLFRFLLKVCALIPPAVQSSSGAVEQSTTNTACSTITTMLGTQITYIPVPCTSSGTAIPSVSGVSASMSASSAVEPPGEVSRPQPTLTSTYGSQSVNLLSSGASAGVFPSNYAQWSSGAPLIYPSWNYNWRDSISLLRYQSTSGPTAHISSGNLPASLHTPPPQNSGNQGLTPSAIQPTGGTGSPPIVPIQNPISGFMGTGLPIRPTSPKFGTSTSSQPQISGGQPDTAPGNTLTSQGSPSPSNAFSMTTSSPTGFKTSAGGGKKSSSILTQPITRGPSQTSDLLFVSQITSTTLNPIGVIASSSARAVQSSIAAFIPIIQSYINKPGGDTSKDAINAIQGVLPIAKVMTLAQTQVQRVQLVTYQAGIVRFYRTRTIASSLQCQLESDFRYLQHGQMRCAGYGECRLAYQGRCRWY